MVTKYNIHTAKITELAEILWLLSFQFDEHEIVVTEARLQAAAENILDDGRLGFFLLARQADQAIGLACVSFCWTLEHGGKAAWLDELYVFPEFRSQGIGGALIEAVLQEAANQGCAAVDLEVDEGHRQAEKLYRNFGFKTLPRTRWVKLLD